MEKKLLKDTENEYNGHTLCDVCHLEIEERQIRENVHDDCFRCVKRELIDMRKEMISNS